MPSLETLVSLPTLAHVMEASARDHGAKLAYSTEADQTTYEQLADDARRLAGSLAASGVRRNDRVVLILASDVDFARMFWAVQRAGAIACALNPYAPAVAVARRAASVSPQLVIYDPRAVQGFEQHMGDLPAFTFEELASVQGIAPPLEGVGADMAWFQPTSGTSGEARLAMISQANAIAGVRAIYESHAGNHSAAHVAWVPPWHDLGLVRFVVGPMFVGASVHIVPPSIQTIPRWLETVARTKAGITGAPDFAYRIATHLVRGNLDLSSLRYAVSGGEPVRLGTVQAFEERFSLPGTIHAGYGLAEATLAVSYQRSGTPLVVDGRGAVSCGPIAPGLEVRIQKASAEDETGEILVRGESVFAGYFRAPESTAETLRDGWLHTGDIGRLDDSGHLYVLGRRRAMIKRGGAMVAPRELEDAALSVEGVRLAAAVGILADETRSTESIVLAAEMTTRRGDFRDIAAKVSAAVGRETGAPPDRVLILEPRAIPITWNGKIRHAILREEIDTPEMRRRVLFDTSSA